MFLIVVVVEEEERISSLSEYVYSIHCLFRYYVYIIIYIYIHTYNIRNN